MRESSAAGAAPSAQKRMQLEILKRRRRRVWRNALFILLVPLVMALLSVAERDNQSLRGSVQRCHDDLAHACRALQTAFDQGRPAPADLPLPEEPEPTDLTPAEREEFEQGLIDRRSRYIYLASHRAQAAAGRPALVCQDVQMHDLYIRPDQLHVILFDGQRYELLTLHREDLPRMADKRGWNPPK
ncbi:MAG TPA: hypothetical protein P5223_04610 [Phycisphaerae bacterium]|nr:hypothetical protein [Phycisphaerae bacterium]